MDSKDYSFIPAILPSDKEDFLKKIHGVEAYVDHVHIDIADGIFVQTNTLQNIDNLDGMTHVRTALHLMVSKPENHVLRWIDSAVEGVLFHIEATEHPVRVIDIVKEADKTIGIVLNPDTQIAAVEAFVNDVDVVQFMTVQPGAYGGAFVEGVVEKIKEFHYFYPDKHIVADGGITPNNVRILADAGVNDFVVGSFIFEHKKGIKAALADLHDSLT